MAPCLGLEPEQVRIHLAGVGGAFGGREDLSMQIHAAMLALHTDRPVKMVYNREESFVGHIHRHPAKIWMEHRATRDGKLVNVRARILLDGGAYASSSAAVTANAAAFACGPYAVDERADRVRPASTRTIRLAARCAASAPCRAASPHEAQMDKLAAAARHRSRRAASAATRSRPGDTLPTGQRITGSLPGRGGDPPRAPRCQCPSRRSCRATPIRLPGGAGQHDARRGRQARRRLRRRLQERLLLGRVRRLDRGRACGCSASDDGLAAEVHCAAAEVGQGVVERDPASGSHRARHSTMSSLGSATTSCGRLRRLGVGLAHDLDGRRRGAARGASRATSCAPRRQLAPARRSTSSASTATARRRRSIPRPARSPATRAHVAYVCAAMRVVAEVDVELGLTRVVWIGTAQDVGKAVNPQAVYGQIEGGIAQGLGLALMEEIQTRDGLITNASFTDYLDADDAGHAAGGRGARRGARAGRALRASRASGEPPTVVSTAADRLSASRRDRPRAHPRARQS